MLNQIDKIATIKSIPWFHGLSAESTHQLLEVAEFRSIEYDEVVFAEGAQNASLYLILTGRIQVESLIPGHGMLPIYFAEPLDVIGWSSLTPVVRHNPCCARGLEKSRLLAFQAKKLEYFCEINHDLGYIIMRRLANIVASSMLNHRLKLLGLISGDIP